MVQFGNSCDDEDRPQDPFVLRSCAGRSSKFACADRPSDEPISLNSASACHSRTGVPCLEIACDGGYSGCGGSPVAQGSGFFVSPTLVATNLHVLKRASQGYIKVISDGGIYKIADVFGISLNHDVCLLHIKEGPGVPLPEATAEPTVGDDIIVAGNPEGLEGTFSKGIVSGIRSSSQLIQIDAPISPGSSGGPVVNNRGEVIGLAVSSLINGQNLNFAVPIKYMTDWALDHNISVSTAGHLALIAREAEGFRGHVRTYVESRVKYTYEKGSGKYVPGPWLERHAETFTPDGRLAQVEFFQEGKGSGLIAWKYSDSGLLKRRIEVDSHGHKSSQELSESDAIAFEADQVHFDQTVQLGDSNSQIIDEYDSLGHHAGWEIPSEGRKFIIQPDTHGWDGDVSEYLQGKLLATMRSSYEVNEYGDWVVQYQMLRSESASGLGFQPFAEINRDITYYSDRDQ